MGAAYLTYFGVLNIYHGISVFYPFGSPAGSWILYKHYHPIGLLLVCHKCLGYKIFVAPQMHLSAGLAIVIEAICGLESKVDHVTFATKIESIKG